MWSACKGVDPGWSAPAEATLRASLQKGRSMSVAVLAHVRPPPRQRWPATSRRWLRDLAGWGTASHTGSELLARSHVRTQAYLPSKNAKEGPGARTVWVEGWQSMQKRVDMTMWEIVTNSIAWYDSWIGCRCQANKLRERQSHPLMRSDKTSGETARHVQHPWRGAKPRTPHLSRRVKRSRGSRLADGMCRLHYWAINLK